MTGAVEPALRLRSARARWVLLTTVLGSGLTMLDATVVNVALGRIGTDMGAGFSGLQWTINAYTLTLAALILLGGSLGDRYGRRRVFLIGVSWFAAASLLSGLAPNLQLLVAARALQGIGGALLTPGSLAIISASFHGADRAAAVGIWSGLGGLAGAVGPFLGGWLVEWTWRAVFLVNLPLAVVIVAVAARHVPESRDLDPPAGFDVTGTVLAAVGLGALTYSLTAAGERGGSPVVIVLGVAGLVALAGFVALERRSAHPLVPTSLFSSAQFSAANAVTFLVYAALGVVFLLLVLQLQVVSGFSPLLAGTALLPVTALMLLLSAREGALAERIGPRLPMTVGPLVCAMGLLLMTRIGPVASYPRDVLPSVGVFGAGLSLTVAPLTATVLASVPDQHSGVASGVNNAIARAAGLLAVAVIPVAAGITGAAYAVPSAFAAGFRAAMLISAGLLGCAALLSAALIRRSPAAPGPPSAAPDRIPIERCPHCAVTGPAVHPTASGSASAR
jgi:EmrB/QacA subfamily drug resistance transporter